jgi:hypothetical protein
MRLRDIIDSYKGKVIKIGARYGSAFIYCDECSEETKRILERMSDRDVLEMRHIIERKQYQLQSSRFTNIEKRTAKSVLEQTRAKLDNYVRLIDREILEIYETVDCPDQFHPMIKCIAIIIQGNEVGKFWTLNEYKEIIDASDYKVKGGGRSNEN